MRIQQVLDSDIAMVFDECLAYPASEKQRRPSRCAFAALGARAPGARAGDGRCSASCRAASTSAARRVAATLQAHRLRRLRDRRPRGRRAEGQEAERCSTTAPRLPEDRPRYLMGVGTPRTSSRRWRRASTCSTACCRRATRETAGSSRATATSASATPATATTRAARRALRLLHLPQLHPRLPLPPGARPRRSSGARLNTLHNLHYYQELMRELRAPRSSRKPFHAKGKGAAGGADPAAIISAVFSLWSPQ